MPLKSRHHELRQLLHSLTGYFHRYWALVTASVALILGTSLYTFAKDGEGPPGANVPPVPVTATSVKQQSMPVWIDVQGTVIPLNYVNVMPRVAGLLQSVDFREGQSVKEGQVLATIDPRPFRIQVDQAQAQLLRDEAQLSGAQSDLERYETLLAQDSIAVQQVVDQRATVAQLKGTVASDKAALENAQLQLEWTRITSPRSGIVGLRLVDVGNMVGTSGAIGGGGSALSGTASVSTPIVTIAQVQPITVTFAIAQNQLPTVLDRMRGATLPVQAWDQRRKSLLDSGKVTAVDNQINTATGTVMIKAQFANPRLALFPNQFVNVRLLVDTLDSAIVAPAAAIASGASGNYVYVIDDANKVSVRPVTTGVSNQDYTVISSGLKAGERVVTDGLDRLRSGSTVQVVAQYGSNAAPADPKSRAKEGKPEGAHSGQQSRGTSP